MTPVEKLEAAIWVLEAEKAAAGPDWEGQLRNIGLPNALPWHYDLYSTLHRTIDVQFAILSGALGDAEGSHDEPAAFEKALDLADAILGGA